MHSHISSRMRIALHQPDIAGNVGTILKHLAEQSQQAHNRLAATNWTLANILLTNIDGTYLGDPDWEPVFRELDRRHARVLIHPTSPVCWEHTSLGRPRPMLEFLFDTTRAVVNLVLNGSIARHPDLRLVIPHAGATLPVIADRVALFSLALGTDASVDVLRDLGRLHYDLSGTPIPRQLDALLAITTLDHLHYGSDYPFTPDFVAALATDALDGAGEPPGSLAEAMRANTRALFPRLAAEH